MKQRSSKNLANRPTSSPKDGTLYGFDLTDERTPRPSGSNSASENSKFLYCGPGAERWLKLSSKEGKSNREYDKKIVAFLTRQISNCLIPMGHLSVLVLGCSNLAREAALLKILSAEYSINLYLVDYSRELLDFAVRRAGELTLADCQAIRADFTNARFWSQFRQLRHKGSPLLVLFLGFTFCNFPVPVSIQCLTELTSPDDLLVMDACVRQEVTRESEVDLRRLERSRYDSDRVHFFSLGLASHEASSGQAQPLTVQCSVDPFNSMVAEFLLSPQLNSGDESSFLKLLSIRLLDSYRLSETLNTSGYAICGKLLKERLGLTLVLRRKAPASTSRRSSAATTCGW